MKKKVIITLFVLLIFLIISPVAYADDELDVTINQQLDSIDFDAIEEKWDDYIQQLTGSKTFREYIKDILDGKDNISIESILSHLSSSAFSDVKVLIPMIISIVAVCIINSLVVGIKGEFLGASISSLLNTICYCVVLVVSLKTLSHVASDTLQAVSSMQYVMQAVFPISITLLSAVGCTSASGGLALSMSMVSNLIVNIVSLMILPMFSASMILAIVGNLSDNVKLSRLRSGVHSLASWIIGVVFGVFSILITAQSVVAGSIDNVVVRSAKMALSGYVPILGQYLSDGVDIVFTTTIMLKNAVGVGGLVILVVSLLVPLVKVIVLSLAFRITAGIIESFAQSRISKALEEFGKNVNLLTASMLGCAFVTIVGLLTTINIGGIV